MRFSNGFFGENEATLGTLRFSAMRREVFEENADGTPSEVVKERTYDLKSDKQGRMIQVSVPASVARFCVQRGSEAGQPDVRRHRSCDVRQQRRGGLVHQGGRSGAQNARTEQPAAQGYSGG